MAEITPRVGWPNSSLPRCAGAASSGRSRRCSRGGVREYAATGLADVDSGEPATPQTVFRVASVTKPVHTAAALLSFGDSGTSLDTPLCELLPHLRPRWRASTRITVRHALSHTSGLHRDLPEMLGLGDGDDALGAAVDRVVGAGQAFRPAAAWQYCNAGYWLVGAAIARLGGTTFEDALTRRLLGPLGMDHTGFTVPAVNVACGHRSGAAVREAYPRARRPSGGLLSTVDDLLSFAEYLLDDPAGAAVLAAMAVPVAPTLWGGHYGLGCELAPDGSGGAGRPGGQVWHDGSWGGFATRLVLVPARRLALVVLVNDGGGYRVLEDLTWGGTAALGVPGPGRLRRGAVMARAMLRAGAARVGPRG